MQLERYELSPNWKRMVNVHLVHPYTLSESKQIYQSQLGWRSVSVGLCQTSTRMESNVPYMWIPKAASTAPKNFQRVLASTRGADCASVTPSYIQLPSGVIKHGVLENGPEK